MRLFLSPPQKHVAIIIDQHLLTCAWLEQPSARAPFIIKAYTKKELPAPNSADCLFSPTTIGTTISHFIKKQMPTNSYKHALISCAFAPPLMYERLTKLNHATPQTADFESYNSSHATQYQYPNLINMALDYHYLYPTDSLEYVFYVCAITQSLLLQYKLLALTHELNLHITTSQTAALFQLYRYIHSTAFRSAGLGIDMQRAHNNPELLFSDEMLKRVITIPAHNFLLDKKTALTFAGLMAQNLSS